MTSAHRGSTLVYLAVGALAGGFMSAQSRVNGELSTRLHDPPITALISFGSGMIILLVISILSRRTRAGFGLVITSIREKRLAWFFLLAGVSGAFFVFSQSLVVGVTGVAVFSIAFVCGLILGSYGLDVWGFGPAGRQPVTIIRTIGAILAIGAVAITMVGRFGEPQGLYLVILPLVFGGMVAWQQVANGLIALAAKTPLTAATINFVVGTGVLAIMAGVYSFSAGLPRQYPSEPWLYLGGLCGVFFVSMTAWVVRHVGALVTSLATTVGQLVSAIAFDLFTPQTNVDLTTMFLGTATMIAAMVLVVLSRQKTGLLAQK